MVIGTSWGGLHALRTILGGLPGDFTAPIIIVQHRHRDSDRLLQHLLQDVTPLCVCEVEDKEAVEPRHVYLAPPNYHLLVEEDAFALSTDEPVRFSRPSIDVTFESAADTMGPRVTGVVLTGANDDGAMGLRRVVDAGGYAIVEDPADAESPTMPRAALRMVPEARVLPLRDIAPHLGARLRPASAPPARPAGAPQPTRPEAGR